MRHTHNYNFKIMSKGICKRMVQKIDNYTYLWRLNSKAVVTSLRQGFLWLSKAPFFSQSYSFMFI